MRVHALVPDTQEHHSYRKCRRAASAGARAPCVGGLWSRLACRATCGWEQNSWREASVPRYTGDTPLHVARVGTGGGV